MPRGGGGQAIVGKPYPTTVLTTTQGLTVWKLLKRLNDPAAALEIVKCYFQGEAVLSNLQNTVKYKKNPELEIVRAVEKLYELKRKTLPQAGDVRETMDDDGDDASSLLLMPPPQAVAARFPVDSIANSNDFADTNPPSTTATSATLMQHLPPMAAALVSDAESSTSHSGLKYKNNRARQDSSGKNVQPDNLPLLDFWDCLHEHVQLQVLARNPTGSTLRRVARHYDIYRLSSSCCAALEPVDSLTMLCRRIRSNFLALFDGTTKVDLRYSECRVYGACHKGQYYLFQIHLGVRSSSSANRGGVGGDHVAMVRPNGNWLALAGSGRFTDCILAALDCALTSTKAVSKDFGNNKLPDFSGTDPMELLRAAEAVERERNQALGRFARQARRGAATDAVTDLVEASHASLLARENEAAKSGSEDGDGDPGSAATTPMGPTIVDQSSRSIRKRARDEEFGEQGDLPKRTCLRWDWKGPIEITDNPATTTTFKCRVVVQGSDVFQGMRAMMTAGMMPTSVPVYVKDAASMGDGGTIVVENSAVRARRSKKTP